MKFNEEKFKSILLGAIVGSFATILIGFAWGGWVLEKTSSDLSLKMTENAVLDRLTPMCIEQFNQDPEKDKKLETLKKIDTWRAEEFVREQGWATIPFEKKPDRHVADRCASLILDKSL
jgi:hypothetical protein